jgi:hypothetical protein
MLPQSIACQLRPSIAAVRNHLGLNAENAGPARPDPIADVDLIATHIARVEIEQNHLAIQLPPVPDEQNEMQKTAGIHERQHNTDNSKPPVGRNDPKAKLLIVPWKKPPSKQSRQIIPPVGTSPRQDQRPIRAETRAKLIAAIATGRQWLDELVTGTIQNVEQIADREKYSIRQVNRTITLAFLAPGSFRRPSRDDYPEVSASQGCASYRPNGCANITFSDWHHQNLILKARAGTRIFAAGDRLPVLASPR